MYKNATFREKFKELQDWLPMIVESIKKDLKNEHLKKDLFFVKKYLAMKNLNKISSDELAQAYQIAIQSEEKGEDLAEFITSRWLLKNSELYDFFEKKLSQISADFTELEELSPEQSNGLIEEGVAEFGPNSMYIFSVLNSVVFPESCFELLKKQSQKTQSDEKTLHESLDEQASLDKMKKNHERELARITDKFEKKLSGLQKKYLIDVETFKKQIAQLQRKLSEKNS